MIAVVSSNPAGQYILNSMLGLIASVGLIAHYVLIDLNYPANLRDFFSQIFPLISFDLVPTDELYSFVFETDLYEDGPISEQFYLLGY